MIKVSKTVKGEDKMNTKTPIENKKISDILKGVLAAGLVVGSMLTSTACKPNQPQESSSSTSKIETTTSETTKIDEPIVRTDEQIQNFISAIDSLFKFKVDMNNNSVVFASGFNEDTGNEQFRFVVISNDEGRIAYMLLTDISKEEYFKIFNDLSNKGKWSSDELSEKTFAVNYLIENCNGESLDLMTEIINKELARREEENKELQN